MTLTVTIIGIVGTLVIAIIMFFLYGIRHDLRKLKIQQYKLSEYNKYQFEATDHALEQILDGEYIDLRNSELDKLMKANQFTKPIVT